MPLISPFSGLMTLPCPHDYSIFMSLLPFDLLPGIFEIAAFVSPCFCDHVRHVFLRSLSYYESTLHFTIYVHKLQLLEYTETAVSLLPITLTLLNLFHCDCRFTYELEAPVPASSK